MREFGQKSQKHKTSVTNLQNVSAAYGGGANHRQVIAPEMLRHVCRKKVKIGFSQHLALVIEAEPLVKGTASRKENRISVFQKERGIGYLIEKLGQRIMMTHRCEKYGALIG